ncbi:MAG: tRNA (N(6)-L-threonylcarbamoyladenosine(37)-C(2))-methylthiotransferase MtaB [Magnetococcales bacterium]|nr:tRNA (N(6)-L-threonylcarbamoyladenosine(37)-C(2))-methylthiotransferase MtaB [Magnetococcales bacterium]
MMSSSPLTMTIVTLGCRVNQVDSEWLRRCAQQQGYRQAMAGDEVNLVVINTCSVTADSDRQARQEVYRAVQAHPQALVVVTGCYAERERQAITAIPGVALVFGNGDKQQFPQLLRDLQQQHGVALSPPQDEPYLPITERSRAWLQVQNGCNERCTFCLIPQLRGESRSEPLPSILHRAQQLQQAGYHELVLTGINLGSYGRDLTPAITLADLVGYLLEQLPLNVRLRLSSIDPLDIDDGLVALLAAQPRLCPHLHLSIQSGDDLILKRMHRRYGRDQLFGLVTRLRQARPDLLLGADIIVGFPSETIAAFDNSCSLVTEAEITLLHLFRYSDRPGTAAAAFPQRLRVTADEMRRRSTQLRLIGQRLCTTVAQRYIGRQAQVLVESITTDEQGDVHFKGRSEWFLPVVGRTNAAIPIGAIQPMQLDSFDDGQMNFIGRVCGDGSGLDGATTPGSHAAVAV